MSSMERGCECIDAEVFVGDMLHDDDRRRVLKQYIERWQRAIAYHESLSLDEDDDGDFDEAKTGEEGAETRFWIGLPGSVSAVNSF